MKKILILSIFVLFLTACGNEEVENKDDLKEKEMIYVETIKPEIGEIKETITFSSNLKPKEIVNVSAKTSGEVKNIYKNIGDNVYKNQIIAVLDDENYKLSYNKAKTALENAKNNYELNEIKFLDAKEEYENNKKLFAEKIISKNTFDKIENNYNLAKKQLEASEIAIKNSQNDLALANKNLADTRIKSPVSGVLSKKLIEKGENINAGVKIFEIVDVSKLRLDINLTEDNIFKVEKGQEVIVGSGEIKGKIKSISPVIDQNTNTYPVEIEVSDEKLKSGMYVDITITLNKKEEVLLMNKENINKDSKGHYVYLFKDENVEKKYIDLGLEEENKVEIIAGLKADDEIIIATDSRIKEGVKVKKSSDM